jgi:phosphonate transport system permease protein
MGLAILLGGILGFFASTAWWAEDPVGGQSNLGRILRRTVAPASYVFFRALIAIMRSVHELLWAVLFLAALGLSEFGAILAIAIPYSGVLAKVYSEMIDEAPRDAARALRAAGASTLQVYCFALVPRALPDMVAYSFYRLECALRSSAILGFFGFPTLGLYIRQSFSSTNYGEVWTYLYVLIALVVLLDAWSAGMRRRISA